MAHVVGPKGQVVIEKEIRERLGIQPGWQALQVLADDHVRIYFIPPEHTQSLRGIVKPFIRREGPPPSEEEFDEAIAEGIAEEFERESSEE